MNLRQSENIAVLGLFLGGIGILAGALLAWVNMLTAEPIRLAEQEHQLEMLRKLRLPEFDTVGSSVAVDDESGTITFLPVARGGKIVGYAGSAANHRGYAGPVEVLAGLDTSGRITGVQVLKHRETPGLGAEVCARTYRRTVTDLTAAAPEIPANAFLDQFEGRRAGDGSIWQVRKDGGTFEYRTGATVSSRAVTAQLGDIVRCWQQQFGTAAGEGETR